MITFVLGTFCLLLALLWLTLLSKTIHTQRKALKVCSEFTRTVHKLALDNAETEPFARIYLDEHRKYMDRLYDLGEPVKTGAER
ncbi:hypothetical protein [Spirillospora sp. CA-294931]|uniref:hypothetical protein n=1 Tax=Spirillospora sp. CA-294931 TaxID=3240042 RepID=UPI003D8FD896